MIIEKSRLKSEAFAYYYNGIKVKVKLNLVYDEMNLSIGLSNPNNEYGYENWFSKIGTLNSEGKYVFGSEYIEHPPFRYYAKFILKDNTLVDFFKVLKDKLETVSETDVEINSSVIKTEKERMYTLCFVKIPNGRISNETIELINKKFNKEHAIKIIEKCKQENLTVRFTNDINKAKKLRVN